VPIGVTGLIAPQYDCHACTAVAVASGGATADRLAIPRKPLRALLPRCQDATRSRSNNRSLVRKCALVKKYAHAATHDEEVFIVVGSPNWNPSRSRELLQISVRIVSS